LSPDLATAFSSARILIIDDEELNHRVLRRILERDGFRNMETRSSGIGVEALVKEYRPDLILLDLHMPHPDGYEILEMLAARVNGPGFIPVLVLTGDATSEAKRKALSLGARDFLAKPFDSTEALLRIRNLLETSFLYRTLSSQNVLLEARVAARTSDLKLSELEILERLARTCEVRDDETGRHTQRVGEMSAEIASSMGMDARFVELICRTAPLHDIGKIGIPDNILLKPGKLTPEQTETMRQHTVIGSQILSGGSSELMIMAERIALSHHERWDGGGYPHGLAGDAIPIEARIVAVADCVDALAHNRPYRASLPVPAILDELRRSSGSHFDPEVVEAMLETTAHRRISVSPPRPWQAFNGELNAV
jgi:putative two-component system response regulator